MQSWVRKTGSRCTKVDVPPNATVKYLGGWYYAEADTPQPGADGLSSARRGRSKCAGTNLGAAETVHITAKLWTEPVGVLVPPFANTGKSE